MYKKIAYDLYQIFNENAYLSIIINENIKKIDDKNQTLYTKIMYGVVEQKLALDYQISFYTKGKRIKPLIKNILRMGIYMLDELNIPKYAVVNELVDATKKIDFHASALVNSILRNYLRDGKKEIDKKDMINYISIYCSIPYDIVQYLYPTYQDKLLTYYKSSNHFNHYRINNLKTNLEEIITFLNNNNIIYEMNNNFISTPTSLINYDIFKEGKIISMDYSSMQVIEFLDHYNYNEVLDVASAPGMKACYLAEKMNNKGHITCCDIYLNKINKIKENVNKLGINNIDTLLADARTYSYPIKYDLIICDAPCSGLGTINHKPDLKYHLKLDDIKDIINLQEDILNHIKDYLNDDGIILYSTCTINKEENENQINKFLINNPNFKLIKEQNISPSELQDGFYMAIIKKGDNYE